MAFVIPSKHIYNKDNDKLRDNKIDRIEVGAFEVVPNNEYETPVYNSDISFDLSSLEIVENSDKEKYERRTDDMFDTLEYDGGYVYFDNKVKYLSSVLTIPKLKSNNFISKLYYGKDNENKNEVKYSLILNKTKKPVSASVELGFTTAKLISKSYGKLVDEGNKTQEDIKLPITIKNTEGGVIVSVDGVQDETNMTVNFVEYENEYRLSYKVLVYMYSEWYTGGYKDVIGNPGYSTQTIEAKGYVEEYTPLKLEITVYGNTIGIDLTDKTIYVPNQSGNKPFFVEGNELMQKSNICLDSSNLLVEYKDSNKAVIKFKDGISKSKNTYVTINIHNILNGEDYIRVKGRQEIIRAGETQTRDLSLITDEWIEITSAYTEDNQISESFSKTLSSYSQGKETATIRCAIADYINYISATVVEYIKYDEENRVWCVLDVKNSYLAEKILQAENLKIHGIECMVVDAEDTKIYINFYSLSIVPYLEKGTLTIPLKEIDINNNNGKMAFDIYDEVIPMVYTANQTDKPMSRYKDGSAKTFVVLGTKIYFDGAVWQELTLQEK